MLTGQGFYLTTTSISLPVFATQPEKLTFFEKETSSPRAKSGVLELALRIQG